VILHQEFVESLELQRAETEVGSNMLRHEFCMSGRTRAGHRCLFMPVYLTTVSRLAPGRHSPTLSPYLSLVASSIELVLKSHTVNDCDYVLSEGSPVTGHPPAFDSETYAQHFQRWLRGAPCAGSHSYPSGSSTVIPQKRSSAQPQRSSIFHQLRPIVFGIL
jgi:hypothetical protein